MTTNTAALLGSPNLIGHMAWELQASEAMGLSFSSVRFMVAFLLSVIAGIVFRFIPTSRGVATVTFMVRCKQAIAQSKLPHVG